ncbi:MAG: iron uptake system component EfeO [Acidimicrobiaceae bacterium]
MRRLAIVPIVAIAMLAVAACGSDSTSTANGSKVDVTLTDEGCNPTAITVAPGKTTFHIRNDGAGGITEFYVYDGDKVLGERENLTPGLSGDLQLELKEGAYRTFCPGGTTKANGTLTVTAGGADHGASGSAGGAADAACVPAGDPASASTHLVATLRDFQIELGARSVTGGRVAIDATNEGTHPHEIIVVNGVAPAALVFDAAGKVDEDKLPSGALIGELEAFSPGRSCSAVFDLAPGSYTLFCNTSGAEGAHATLGMVTTLTVS